MGTVPKNDLVWIKKYLQKLLRPLLHAGKYIQKIFSAPGPRRNTHLKNFRHLLHAGRYIGKMFSATSRLRFSGYPASVISAFWPRLRFSGYPASELSSFRSRLRFSGRLASDNYCNAILTSQRTIVKTTDFLQSSPQLL